MSGFCKWCDTLTNSIITVYEKGRLVWVGCTGCYEKKKELEKNVTE
jgi:hypothetical protein